MPTVIFAGASDTDKTNTLINNRVLPTNITASSSAVGYNAVNVSDEGTSLSWRPATMPATLAIDVGSAIGLNGVGIAAHTLATSATTVFVEHSSNNTTWTTLGSVLPTTNDELFIMLPLVNARYWRIRLTGGAPNIGVLFIGRRFIFPHTPVIDYRPLNHARSYNKYFNDSLGGNFINSRVESAGASIDVDMGFVTRNFADTALPPFSTPYNMGRCFFYASSPAKYPLDVGYCRAGGQNDTVQVDYIEKDHANLSFTLRAYVGYP